MEKFYIGLDIGTDSVGIACTDEQYKLLRTKGKDMWAVRLFDEANTAVERRQSRTARRRLQRRAARIDCLQELFAPYMADEKFFLRLNNSGFLYEDKDEKLQTPYSLFADSSYSDKDFYKQFPTIFHLRQTLSADSGTYDVRLYYLAIHHIVKYRGHFLFEGQSMKDACDVAKLFEEANAVANEYKTGGDDSPYLDPVKAEEFKRIVLQDKTVNDRVKEVQALFGGGRPLLSRRAS